MMICVTACRSVLRRAGGADPPVGVEVAIPEQLDRVRLVLAADPQLLEHLPADPEQQQAAGEQEPGDVQELRRDQREADAHQRRRGDADDDRLAPQLGRETRRGEADDDRVVAGEHQVDHDHLEERGQETRLEHQASPPAPRAATAPGGDNSAVGGVARLRHSLHLP